MVCTPLAAYVTLNTFVTTVEKTDFMLMSSFALTSMKPHPFYRAYSEPMSYVITLSGSTQFRYADPSKSELDLGRHWLANEFEIGMVVDVAHECDLIFD